MFEPKFKNGEPVKKIKGAQWRGKIVGTYSTELTPEGYAVESFTEKGSVQIYPAAALALIPLTEIQANCPVCGRTEANEAANSHRDWCHTCRRGRIDVKTKNFADTKTRCSCCGRPWGFE